MHIGPYEIVLELGRGGMGTVYLARLRGAGGFERLVAVKRANVSGIGADEVRQRFLQEARLAASVHHANVVGIHQVGEDEVGPYLVSDYVEGESLARLIDICRNRSALPTRIALRVIHDALAGLAAVHDTVDGTGKPMGILHRDVSIDNLLVGCDGVTRLADFGIAKSSVEPRLTNSGRIHGKVLYMAPEHLMGEERDRSTDTYAMGIALWIALADGLPFTGRDHDTLVNQVLTQPIPPLSGVGADVGPALDAFVARACHRDRTQRFATAQTMMEALEVAAKRECPLASHREVAAFMAEMAGEALALRRERVAASTLGQPASSSTPSSSPENAQPTDARVTQPLQLRRRPSLLRELGVAAAVLIAAMLATYAFWPRAKPATPLAQPEPAQPRPSPVSAPASPRPTAVAPTAPVSLPLATPPEPERAPDESKPTEPKRPAKSRARVPPSAPQNPAPSLPAAEEPETPETPGIATQNPYR